MGDCDKQVVAVGGCHQPILSSAKAQVSECSNSLCSWKLASGALVGFFPDMIGSVNKTDAKLSDLNTHKKEEAIFGLLLANGSTPTFEQQLSEFGAKNFSGHIFDYMILRTISMLTHCFNDESKTKVPERYSDWLATLQLGASSLLHYNKTLGVNFFGVCAKRSREAARWLPPIPPNRFGGSRPETLKSELDYKSTRNVVLRSSGPQGRNRREDYLHLIAQYVEALKKVNVPETLDSSRLAKFKDGQYRENCFIGRNVRQLFPDESSKAVTVTKAENNSKGNSGCRPGKSRDKEYPRDVIDGSAFESQPKAQLKLICARQEAETRAWEKLAHKRDPAKKAAKPVTVCGDARIVMNLTVAFIDTICEEKCINEEYLEKCKLLKNIILDRLDCQKTKTETSEAVKALQSLIQWSLNQKETTPTVLQKVARQPLEKSNIVSSNNEHHEHLTTQSSQISLPTHQQRHTHHSRPSLNEQDNSKLRPALQKHYHSLKNSSHISSVTSQSMTRVTISHLWHPSPGSNASSHLRQVSNLPYPYTFSSAASFKPQPNPPSGLSSATSLPREQQRYSLLQPQVPHPSSFSSATLLNPPSYHRHSLSSAGTLPRQQPHSPSRYSGI